MKILLLLSLILVACSSNQERKPSVTKELCFDYDEDSLICNNNDKCYLTDVSDNYRKEISCKEFEERSSYAR